MINVCKYQKGAYICVIKINKGFDLTAKKMKTLTIIFKENGKSTKITSSNWNDFSIQLFKISPMSYTEDIEDLEKVFTDGKFDGKFIKIS